MEIKFNKLEEEERRIFSKWGKKHSEEGLLKVLPPAKFVKYIATLSTITRKIAMLLLKLLAATWLMRLKL